MMMDRGAINLLMHVVAPSAAVGGFDLASLSHRCMRQEAHFNAKKRRGGLRPHGVTASCGTQTGKGRNEMSSLSALRRSTVLTLASATLGLALAGSASAASMTDVGTPR